MKRLPGFVKHRLTGYVIFVLGMAFLTAVAHPVILRWRQTMGLAAFGLLIGFASYHCGWIVGSMNRAMKGVE